ncbi:hypothetical protein ACJX0J_021491, partial [Zea mays]
MYTNSWPSAQEFARGPQEVRFYISQEVQIPIPSKNASEDKIREQTKNYIMMEQQTLLICLDEKNSVDLLHTQDCCEIPAEISLNTEWQPMFAILLMKTSYYNIIQWMDLALHPLRQQNVDKFTELEQDSHKHISPLVQQIQAHRYITIFFHNHARQIHIINSTGFFTTTGAIRRDLKQFQSIFKQSHKHNHLTKGRIKLQHKFSSLNFHFYQFLNLYIILYIQIAHEVKAQGHKKMRMLVFSYQFQLQKNNLEHQFLLTPGQQHIIYDKTKWARVTILVYNEGLSDMLLHISAGQQVAAERIIASICNSLIEGFSDIFLARVTILTNYNCEQTVPDRNRVPGPQEKNLDLTLR